MFDWLYEALGTMLSWFSSIFGGSYAIALLIYALIFKVVFLPFSIKQQKNQIKMAKLTPQIELIKAKYAGRTDQPTVQKMQQEIMEFQQKEGYSPLSGCLPMLLQFPIIICLYNVVINPLRYISNVPKAEIEALKTFITESGVTLDIRNQQIGIINHIRDSVQSYTSIAPSLENAVIPDFTVGPFDLSQIPEISFAPFNWLMLIPVLTFVVMILSQKITQKFTYQSPEAAEQQNNPSMKIMMWTMPLLSVYIEFQMAAAIGVYWIFRSVISTLERILFSKLIPVPKFTEEDFKAAEREANVKEKKPAKKENKNPVRSLHHIDDEDYIARQEEKVKAIEAEDAAKRAAAGETTEANSEKAAPIKNDEKSTYKNKKD